MTAAPAQCRARPRRLRTLLAAAVLVGAGVPALANAAPAPVVSSTISCAPDGALVPADFLGLSVEWSTVEPWFGRSAASVVPATVELLRGLNGRPGAGGVLRVGGNSQDGYRFLSVRDTSQNTAFAGTISRGMIDALFEVARQSGWTIVLGVNLRVNRPEEAALLTAYAASRDPGHRLLRAVQIGNEPDGYFHADTAAYLARVQRYADLLAATPQTSAIKLVGPDISHRADLAYVRGFEQQFAPRAAYAGFHFYANRPSVARLLDESARREWIDRIQQVQDAAGGLAVRMDEGNSVGSGGLDGVSNVLGSSTWLAETLLIGAQQGLAGVNVHSWDGLPYPFDHRVSYYTPFVVRAGATSSRPSFYALSLLRNLPGTRLCTQVGRADRSLPTTVTLDPDTGVVRAYAVRADTTSPATARFVLPGGVRRAVLRRVADAGGCRGRASSLDGATLGADGRLDAPGQLLIPARDGSVQVTLRPCESAELELTPA